MILRTKDERASVPNSSIGYRLFPIFRFRLRLLLAEGDLVAARHMVIGTHTGEFLGVPPTGKHVSVQEMDVFRIENGVIVESWSAPDLFGMLSQIDALPTPPI
jgi:predicted ester cyclase